MAAGWRRGGLRLDEEETTRDRAEQAYRKAIDLDPRLATALTNLGNLRLVAGDRAEAESMYRRAIASDPSQAEAPYNLAYLLVERGVHHEAVPSAPSTRRMLSIFFPLASSSISLSR